MGVIYLDCAATTPVEPTVVDRMRHCLETDFGNPASTGHQPGRDAAAVVEQGRQAVAELLGADPREVVLTSGATEADNLALQGAARFRSDRGRHIVVGATEHKAVLDTCEALAFAGFEVTKVPPASDGRIEPERVAEALRADTILVSVMHANNETGVINDIAAIGERVRRHGALMHVDAAQTAGKIPLDVGALAVDLVALSAHKNHGPKGVGALWVRRRPRVRLVPLLHGGGHEHGLRAGTVATHQVAGMGEAFALAAQCREDDQTHADALGRRFRAHLQAVAGWHENGGGAPRLGGILNIAFEGVDAESLTNALADRVAMSTGSACTTGSVVPSHVLRAMGQDAATAARAVRVSWGRMTTLEEIDEAAQAIVSVVNRLRSAGVHSVAG